MFFVMSSDDTPVCPVCGGTLKYRDTRLRIRKKEGGVKEYLMIRRLEGVKFSVSMGKILL